MKIRVLTDNNFIDIEIKEVSEETLLQALDDGNTVALTKADGNTFILNTLNVVAIEIFKDNNIPPIK